MVDKVLVGYVATERGRDALVLGQILAQAHGAKLDIVTLAEGGNLADAAREKGADLVVLGSTHRGAWGRIVPGTTMERLLGGAPVSVAVAPPHFADRTGEGSVWRPLDGEGEDTGMRVIGVGYDGSPGARGALDYATELARHNGAALRVYTVVRNAVPIATDAHAVATANAPSELDARRAELHEVVAALPAEVRAQPVLLRGFPVPELIKAAGFGVDLLVLGTHVRGHVGRLLRKNVADEVVLEAPCPVLICPTPVGVRATA